MTHQDRRYHRQLLSPTQEGPLAHSPCIPLIPQYASPHCTKQHCEGGAHHPPGLVTGCLTSYRHRLANNNRRSGSELVWVRWVGHQWNWTPIDNDMMCFQWSVMDEWTSTYTLTSRPNLQMSLPWEYPWEPMHHTSPLGTSPPPWGDPTETLTWKPKIRPLGTSLWKSAFGGTRLGNLCIRPPPWDLKRSLYL